MGPTWVLSAPDGPHVGPMNLAIRVSMELLSTLLALCEGNHNSLVDSPYKGLVKGIWLDHEHAITSQIARFVRPTWGPTGAGRTQLGPMLAPWTLLSGMEMLSTLLTLYEENALVIDRFTSQRARNVELFISFMSAWINYWVACDLRCLNSLRLSDAYMNQ